VFIGQDANSEKFWDKYLEFEVSQQEWEYSLAVYQQLLAVPTRVLDKYWDGFKQLVSDHPDMLPEGEEASRAFMDKWTAVYTKSAAHRDLRCQFEALIKRSYFHVRPLDKVQIQNWRDYTDFEMVHMTAGASDDTVARRLFERCLISCCNYAEFWKKYIKFLLSRGDKEAARAVAQRSVCKHLKQNAEMHTHVAEMEEVEGNIEASRKIHQNIVSSVAPGLMEGVLNMANFERRQGEYEAVAATYEVAIEAGGNSKQQAFLSMHYARYLSACSADLNKSRLVYKAATDKAPELRLLWQAWLCCEAEQPSGQLKVQAIMARAVGQSTKLEVQDRQDLWQWYLNYLADFGDSLPKLRENEQAFAAQFPNAEPTASASSRKRPLEEQQSTQATKQPRVDESAHYQAQWQQWVAGQQQQQWAAPAAGYPYQ